ncbi:two-component system response regulator YesN [Paenibacillus cellulosilyticus]|uniref:Two-component system response regulator YesN n=1 Tax=Paenibacillus cellulosilyticus TaxID=375489 RepID=A0A2V2YYL3_9BACL|nr:response regulator transcription factor [Paenibacillus cellulosilyticus]PWW07230.1 two-component system response regulator YesN [Paenibacillus cellulosilyticus]QKS44578.1 response regulator transcription factor [Paenibacillus cellulosilyticus]
MYTAIIVDDELFVRKGLMELMDWEASGFRIIGEADNGEDALALIKEMNPDLVITDIRMPILDGIGLIQAAANEQLSTSFIIISGYHDFSYAQQAMRHGVMDYVVKPIDEDEMQDALTRLRDKLSMKREQEDRANKHREERQMELLIRGELEETELSQWKSIWPNARSFTYVLFEINDVLPWNDRVMPMNDVVHNGIRTAIRDAAHSTVEPILYSHRQAYGAIIPNVYLTVHGGSLRRLLECTLHRLREKFQLTYRLFAGKPVNDLMDLKLSYMTAKEAMQFKLLKAEETIILYADVEGLSLYYRYPDDETYRKLTEAVEENNSDHLQQSIGRLFASFQEQAFSPEAIKSAIVQCVLNIMKSIRTMEGDEKELKSLEPIMNWHDYTITLHELRRLFEAFAFEAAALFSKLYCASGKGSIQKIKSYVDRNFHQNLSLKSISAQFYMNSAYLGQLFKKSFGVYFNDYLHQLRIAEAKKLLRQKELRIYEIAERVGFNNADYFVTQFEKLERMTPSEYRNRMNNQG